MSFWLYDRGGLAWVWLDISRVCPERDSKPQWKAVSELLSPLGLVLFSCWITSQASTASLEIPSASYIIAQMSWIEVGIRYVLHGM